MRRTEGVYLVEGVRLVREAIATGQRATLVLYDPALLNRTEAGSSLLSDLLAWAERANEVDERVLRAAAHTETPAGVVAVLRRPEPGLLALHGGHIFGVILDRITDPGNAGTILRTAAAAGVGFVVAVPHTVDLFAPKVVRAGMGAHFRVPLHQGVPWDALVSSLPDVTLVAIDAQGEESIVDFAWPERTALIVGSEAHGVSREAANVASRRVRIPMQAGVESLNASVAASLAIYVGSGLLNSPTRERYR